MSLARGSKIPLASARVAKISSADLRIQQTLSTDGELNEPLRRKTNLGLLTQKLIDANAIIPRACLVEWLGCMVFEKIPDAPFLRRRAWLHLALEDIKFEGQI